MQDSCKLRLLSHVHCLNVGTCAIMQTGQEALRSETGTEILVGLDNNVVVSFGRPDWDDVFQTLKERHPGTRIGVFVCGPKVMVRVLHTSVGFAFRRI